MSHEVSNMIHVDGILWKELWCSSDMVKYSMYSVHIPHFVGRLYLPVLWIEMPMDASAFRRITAQCFLSYCYGWVLVPSRIALDWDIGNPVEHLPDCTYAIFRFWVAKISWIIASVKDTRLGNKGKVRLKIIGCAISFACFPRCCLSILLPLH